MSSCDVWMGQVLEYNERVSTYSQHLLYTMSRYFNMSITETDLETGFFFFDDI